MPVVKLLMSTCKIKTGKQPAQLLAVDGQHLLGQLGPLEAMLFQPLVPQTKSVLVPVQDFDDILAPVAKHKQITAKRIKAHGLLDQHRQPVDRLAQVGAAKGQVHAH